MKSCCMEAKSSEGSSGIDAHALRHVFHITLWTGGTFPFTGREVGSQSSVEKKKFNQSRLSATCKL